MALFEMDYRIFNHLDLKTFAKSAHIIRTDLELGWGKTGFTQVRLLWV
jgi:hypothetical protein